MGAEIFEGRHAIRATAVDRDEKITVGGHANEIVKSIVVDVSPADSSSPAIELDIDRNESVKSAITPVDGHLSGKGAFSDTDDLVDFCATVGTMGEQLRKVVVEISAARLSGMDRTAVCRPMRVRAIVTDRRVRSEQDLRRTPRIGCPAERKCGQLMP